MSWSPKRPRAGDGVVFTAVLRNRGAAATAVGPGVTFFVDSTKAAWAAGGDPLPTGARRVVTASTTPTGAAWTATTGTHTVLAQADSEGQIPESDENNNSATATLTVA